MQKNKIKMVFDIGGGKLQSSSDLVKPFVNYSEKRPWGNFENLLSSDKYLVKKLSVKPGQKLSLQYHNHRVEHWVVVNGKGVITIGKENVKCEKGSYFKINKNQIHRIENNSSKQLEIIEVQLGETISETDIIRLEDTYEENNSKSILCKVCILRVKWLSGRVVMQRIANPSTPVRFRPQPPINLNINN